MSTLKADTIQNTSGGAVTLTNQSAAKAWVFGNTDASLFDSSNISSGVDNGTGDYSYNLTNAFSSANYAVVGSAENDNDRTCQTDITSASVYDLFLRQGATKTDLRNHSITHGDLA